jgi:predicted acylesterase/phospholipase RssA
MRDQLGWGTSSGVTVTPHTRGIGLLEFHKFDAARDAGVRAGEAAVTALREQGWVVPPTANDATPDVGTQSAALTPG